jgi:hypothetical protein
MPVGKTLILTDGGPASLLACACTREAIAMGTTEAPPDALRRPPSDAIVLPFPFAAASRVAAISRQAELFSFQVLPALSPIGDGTMPEHEREAHELLAATHLAARNGCDRVFWPASAGVGENLDLDRIAQIADRAVLISRLVAIDAASHGVPSIHVQTPYADFTDRQIADLIADMEAPIEACWWWGKDGDAQAQQEFRRWEVAMAAVGRPLRA